MQYSTNRQPVIPFQTIHVQYSKNLLSVTPFPFLEYKNKVMVAVYCAIVWQSTFFNLVWIYAFSCILILGISAGASDFSFGGRVVDRTINKSWNLESLYATFINNTVTPNCAFFKTPSHFLWNMSGSNATTDRRRCPPGHLSRPHKTKRCKTANALRDKGNLAVSAVFILAGERAKQMSDFWQGDVDVWSGVDEPPTMRWIGKIVTSRTDVIYPAISERILGGLTGVALTGRVPGPTGPGLTLWHLGNLCPVPN